MSRRIKKRYLKAEDIERFDKIFAQYTDQATYKIVDDKAVILNRENGNYFSLDGSGAYMWELLKENKSLSQIAKETAQVFKVGQKSVSWDLFELVNELIDVDLLEIKDEIP